MVNFVLLYCYLKGICEYHKSLFLIGSLTNRLSNYAKNGIIMPKAFIFIRNDVYCRNRRCAYGKPTCFEINKCISIS